MSGATVGSTEPPLPFGNAANFPHERARTETPAAPRQYTE